MQKRALPLDQQLCFALYTANNEMGRIYRPHLSKLGLTYPQYLVLLALWEHDAQSVGALGKALHLESNTLTPLLKRMEAADLLQRQRSTEDERIVTVSLTDKSRALEEKSYDIALCIHEVAKQGDIKVAALRDQIIELADRLRAGQ